MSESRNETTGDEMHLRGRTWTLIVGSDGQILGYVAGTNRILTSPRMDAREITVTEVEPSTNQGAVSDDELERAAIAVYEARIHSAFIHGWDAEPEALRERCRNAARAVLQLRGAVR